MHILVATPIYDRSVLIDYMESILGMIQAFGKAAPHVQFSCRYIDTAQVRIARNAFATMMLEQRNYTHLLFVDADMGFRPSLIQKLIKANQPIVGAIYPHRNQTSDGPLTYVGTDAILGPAPLPGFVLVREAGTGIMLIQRQVFEIMREKLPHLWSANIGGYEQFGLKNGVFQCFESVRDGDGGLWLGEDYSFCRRWTAHCGGTIWACVSEEIAHVGRYSFRGASGAHD